MPTRPAAHNPSPRQGPAVGNRKTSAQRGYSYKWQKARATYLARHPLCVHCEEEGRVTPATEVDHKIPHKGNSKLFWDSQGNWAALCASCHSRKTATEDGGFGNKARVNR